MSQNTSLAHAQIPQLNFAGKRVWITGAGQGIGHQIAQDFCALGAEVIGFDRHFADDFNPSEYKFTKIRLDITEHEQLAAEVKKLLAENSQVDVLVNTAGILRLGALDEISIADWQSCFDVNASGVFYVLRTLLPRFKQQGHGSIVNIASNAAHVPRINMGAYCASKAALVSLSHCAALELAAFGVRCNVVSPGSTDTPMLRSMLADQAAYQRTIAGLPEQFKLGIPLKKIATPQEIANTVLFLASDLASHITMQDIVVDGGATLAA